MTQSGLSRFMAGGGLNLRSLDTLATYLELELVPTKGKARRGPRSSGARAARR